MHYVSIKIRYNLNVNKKFLHPSNTNSNHHTTPQPFYGPFLGTTQVSQCQKKTSGLYGARED